MELERKSLPCIDGSESNFLYLERNKASTLGEAGNPSMTHEEDGMDSINVQMRQRVPSIEKIHDPISFHALLLHERHRTDRTGNPFSLVTFSLDGISPASSRKTAIYKHIVKTLRNTDEIGWMRDERIGLLLPDTGQESANIFARRAFAREKAPEFKLSTYPDHWIGDYPEEEKGGEEGASDPCFVDAFSIDVPAWKRGIDIVGAFLGLIILSPVFLATMLWIRAVSPGPVLFTQNRVGLGGKLFTFIKFRTMKHHNDTGAHQDHIINCIRDGKALAKLDDSDPRIIPGGRLLRKTCVDELPQLFNVLRGDMSLVGPRPCVVYEAREYKKWHSRRFDALPGMTGLWQVSGKNKLSIDQMIRLDISYASNMSLLRDLSIIARTIPAIVVMVLEPWMKRLPARSAALRRRVKIDFAFNEEGGTAAKS